jgi:hypothetical protein
MAIVSQSKHGGAKKYGRNKVKCANYRSAMTAEHHKAKRVLQSNGKAAYIAYCEAKGLHQTLLGQAS